MCWKCSGLIGTCSEGTESVGLLVTPQPGAVTSLSTHCSGETRSQEPRTPWEAANCRQVGIQKRRRIPNAAGDKQMELDGECNMQLGLQTMHPASRNAAQQKEAARLGWDFSLSYSPISPGNHPCNGSGSNSHCSPQRAFIFPRKSSETKQQ